MDQKTNNSINPSTSSNNQNIYWHRFISLNLLAAFITETQKKVLMMDKQKTVILPQKHSKTF